MPHESTTPPDPYTDNDLTTPQAARLEADLHTAQRINYDVS